VTGWGFLKISDCLFVDSASLAQLSAARIVTIPSGCKVAVPLNVGFASRNQAYGYVVSDDTHLKLQL